MKNNRKNASILLALAMLVITSVSGKEVKSENATQMPLVTEHESSISEMPSEPSNTKKLIKAYFGIEYQQTE